MAEKERQRQALVDSGKYGPDDLERVEIVQDLEPGSYNLDVAGVRDAYLARTAGGGLVAKLKSKTLGNKGFSLGRLFGFD